MITKMFIGDFIHVTADKIEWTPGDPKWIWHVRCDRCAQWPGRTARSQEMAISMAEAHYNDTHSGIRDNNERKSRDSKVANPSRTTSNPERSVLRSSQANSRTDRWSPYRVADRERLRKANGAQVEGNAAKDVGLNGFPVNGDASKKDNNA